MSKETLKTHTDFHLWSYCVNTHEAYASLALFHFLPISNSWIYWTMFCEMCVPSKAASLFFPTTFLKMIFILFQQKLPLEIDARKWPYCPVAVKNLEKIISTMFNFFSLIHSWGHFNMVFTISFHWNCLCQNQKWLSIIRYDLWLLVYILFDQ